MIHHKKDHIKFYKYRKYITVTLHMVEGNYSVSIRLLKHHHEETTDYLIS